MCERGLPGWVPRGEEYSGDVRFRRRLSRAEDGPGGSNGVPPRGARGTEVAYFETVVPFHAGRGLGRRREASMTKRSVAGSFLPALMAGALFFGAAGEAEIGRASCREGV